MIRLTVTAHCIGRCGWSASGDWPAVDSAAEKHAKAGHPDRDRGHASNHHHDRTAAMSRIRDVIIPGSIRTEHVEYDRTTVTVCCGRCSHEQKTSITCRTTRCTACGRVMRLDQAVTDAANVTPIRRRA